MLVSGKRKLCMGQIKCHNTFQKLINDLYRHLRAINLECVLISFGANKDRKDKNKWNTDHGAVSITGQKFFNWKGNVGGGGAIDLVMHLADCDFVSAISWLKRNTSQIIPIAIPEKISDEHCKRLLLPQRDDTKLKHILSYLTQQRAIPETLLIQLIDHGKLYADNKANAVFIMMGRNKRIVGAELRGTGSIKYRGMVPGSNKNRGAFYVYSSMVKKVVLCESAIDALSYLTLNNECITMSTTGARADPLWLSQFVAKGFDIRCGFDADETGDKMAQYMILKYPSIKRIRPHGHDWNDVLKNYKKNGKSFLF